MASQAKDIASMLAEMPVAPADDVIKYTEVQIDGLVVMKIIKHCKESMPELVTGQLLGLDIESTLEVTNCFPFPRHVDGENEGDEDGEDYQVKSLACLREVNVDYNTVGWYMSTYLSNFADITTVAQQFNHQDNLRNAVCLVYDSVRTVNGNLALSAYRLTDKFMDLYRANRFTQEDLAGFSQKDIFEEVPIRVHNPALVDALLIDLADGDFKPQAEFDRFDLSTNPMLERTLEAMIDSVDDLASEQQKYDWYKRKKLMRNRGRETEDNSNEPSRLDSILIASQVSLYCDTIDEFVGPSVAKLFLMNAAAGNTEAAGAGAGGN